MADYIEREKVIDMLANASLICDEDGEFDGYCTEDIDIYSIPSADVAPVVHGKWIEVCDEMQDILKERDPYIMIRGYRCSRCGRFEEKIEPYCNCGAKMEEEPPK